MIFLIGTTHSVQIHRENHPPQLKAKVDRFEAFVEDAALAHAVTAIAEEYSSEEVAFFGGSSVAKAVAERLSVSHQYCELTSGERRMLGIPARHDLLNEAWKNQDETGVPIETYLSEKERSFFRQRERIWIGQLMPLLPGRILYILGSAHISTFPARLSENNISWNIICEDWYAEDDKKFGPLPLHVRPI